MSCLYVIGELFNSPQFIAMAKDEMFQSALAHRRTPKCDKGYVLLKDDKGQFTRCRAKADNEHCFCICNGLCSSAGLAGSEEEPLYTVGTNAWRVDRIVTVCELMAELAGG